MAEEEQKSPVNAAVPPKANPLQSPIGGGTVKLNPAIRKPVVGGAQPALKPGLKLPPKPGDATGGVKLPTANAMKPGLKLPPKPMIRKPGTGPAVAARPLPKPIVGAPAAAEPAKLPTVDAVAVSRADDKPVVSDEPKPMEALKSVTQKLKGVTQQIPQQAILRKTGIIADASLNDAQKDAAKHKTARISLSDAMGVAPVKNENAPMKTIRIKRPIDIPGATSVKLNPQPHAPAAVPPAAAAAASTAAPAASVADDVTQRKTLKISRPAGNSVQPSGKFGIKRPGAAAPAESGVADIADIPSIPEMPAVAPTVSADEGSSWAVTLSAIVEMAACVAMGALAWFLFQNTQIAYF